MITIHHLQVSQSERIIWLMEELGLPYALKSYSRDKDTRLAPPEFLKLHPLGSAPVIQDGDVTMAESLAISTYVIDLYGEGHLRIAPGKPGYADFTYWYHYSNAGLMPQAMIHIFAAMAGGTDNSPRGVMMRERFARHLGMINDRLASHNWLAGDQFTAADILCHFPFGTMSAFAPIDVSAYPNIRGWLERISARSAYRKAMKAAGHEKDPAQPGGGQL